MKLPSRMTWRMVLEDESIASLQHPLIPTLVDKHEYDRQFGAVMSKLDGHTLYDVVNTFFARDCVNTSALRFVDSDAQADIVDWAVDEGCLPSLQRKVDQFLPTTIKECLCVRNEAVRMYLLSKLGSHTIETLH